MRSSTLGVLDALAALAALPVQAASSGAAGHGWSLAYVIEAFEPAFWAPTQAMVPGTGCPTGAAPEVGWRKALKPPWRTASSRCQPSARLYDERLKVGASCTLCGQS
jgi:hypothetical protein